MMKSILSLILFLYVIQPVLPAVPVNLTCEFRPNLPVIGTHNSRFGWQLTSDIKEDKQTAYRIIVRSGGRVIWDSGKVKSGQSQLVKYGGKPLASGQTCEWSVEVWDSKGKAVQSETAFFRTAPDFSVSKAQWIGAIPPEKSNLPVGRRNFHNPSLKKPEYKQIYDAIDSLALRSIILRKTFKVNKPIERAVVHISGLGHYKLSVNGKAVSDDIFTPAWSDYDKTVYYNSYSVDSFLSNGDNTLGVLLGNGFYNAVGNRYRKLWITFGPPTLFLEMHISYKDGTEETVMSDESWKYDLSPVTFNDIYGGEDYDARLEQENWDKPLFDDCHWKPVVIQTAPKGILRPQEMTGVRCMEQYNAVSMTKINSSYVLNMGQNLSGYPSVKVTGKRGQTLKLTVGEVLDTATGLVSQKQTGSPHTYSYTLKGEGTEEWHPAFSYYGFQYIQVDGADVLSATDGDKPLVTDIKSCFIYNSVNETGHFESSNEIFNKAHILIKNAVKSNMQTVFTDCPHREKLGWLEETHLNGPGLLYNWDLTQFFLKIMRDMADAQSAGGLVPAIVPQYVVFDDNLSVFKDSPEWGIACILVPALYYEYYGDDSLIRQYFDVMTAYVEHITSRAANHIVSHGLGDWYDYGEHRAGFSQNSPVEVSATAHYFYAARKVADFAKMLRNKPAEKKYGKLAENIKKAYNEKFFDKASKQYANGSQFCNAVSIYMGLVAPKDKPAVLENLKDNIRKQGNRLTTGDIGNRYLFQTLASNGENELMYLMHNHEEVPGYGFQQKFGATTLTEQWDPRQGASRNHFMLGQIDEWFFRSLAGINPDTPGFQTFTVCPQAISGLSYVKASHKTLYGTIVVEWKQENERFHLSVTVPVNTQAIVILPNGEIRRTGSGRHEAECRM